jgi:hypothetical protein
MLLRKETPMSESLIYKTANKMSQVYNLTIIEPLLLVKTISLIEALIGPTAAKEWFKLPLPYFDNKSPQELFNTLRGQQMVLWYIEQWYDKQNGV